MDERLLIRCNQVSFGYDGQVAVRDLSLSVERGDYLCIVGENGSGKSTLLKGLLGLLNPLGGTVVYGTGFNRSETGYLSQQDAAQKDFPAGVYEVALSGNLGRMGPRPFYSREEKERSLEYMRLLGIADLKNRCYRDLSGGQQRRVLLARSLCAAKNLLVLDEPTAGLDPLITADVYALLRKINRETGTAIVMVSHDIEAAGKYAGGIINLGKPLPCLNNRRNSND
jgi:zinc transport system ATP-binding protein